MNSFIISLPQHEYPAFERALLEAIDGAQVLRKSGTPGRKFIVTVTYPPYVKPRVFVQLGQLFQEYVKNGIPAEPETVV